MDMCRDSLIDGHGAPCMDNYEEKDRNGSNRSESEAACVYAHSSIDWTADWFPRLYDELRALAHAQRRRYRDQDSPGTTSIVHEAFERLNRSPGSEPENPLHFYRTAARTMRSVVIDNARRSQAVRHGGHLKRASPEALELVSFQRSDELLALDAALESLTEADRQLGEIVNLRIFGGLTVEELADLLGVSAPTVKRRWKLACAWLYDQLEPNRQ
ncbi:MAG: RNA polymerase subunit sigma-70 [Xanthomonadales bacterium]|nr:RNA polymerase subunit sigma-70 [Xanthomonadales bacterium]